MFQFYVLLLLGLIISYLHTMDLLRPLVAHPVWATALVCIAYGLGLAFHRLYLSPLARFPGPKLAAATAWYEFFYDAVLHGRYTFEIARMHKQYGKVESRDVGGTTVRY